jgi:hypothetical protein
MRVMEHQAGRFRLYAAEEDGVLNMVQTSLPSRIRVTWHRRRAIPLSSGEAGEVAASPEVGGRSPGQYRFLRFQRHVC